VKLAEVLRVDLEELTGEEKTGDGRPRFSARVEIEQAMMRYDAIESSISPGRRKSRYDLAALSQQVDLMYGLYQATRYAEVGRALPRLIGQVEAAARGRGADACAVRAWVYNVTAALLQRIGEPALAWTAADRSVSAAEQSEQPLLIAVATYRLAYVFTSMNRPQAAAHLATGAATALERKSPSSPDHLSVYGGLLLAAATATAAEFDSSATARYLADARRVAERLGSDLNLMGTAFGSINVAVHTMSTAVTMGDAQTAIEIGEELEVAEMPAGLVGRRTQVLLDLARAYAMRRQDAAAVNTLLKAEDASPQLVRYNDHTRDLLADLLRREHRASTPQLRPLARRAGVI
jgi:hypothetical protein